MTEHYQFADLDWQSRWNDMTKPYVDLFETGNFLMAAGPMGVVRFDLDKDEDIDAFLIKMRGFLEAIRTSKRRYDTVISEAEALGMLPKGIHRLHYSHVIREIEGDEGDS